MMLLEKVNLFSPDLDHTASDVEEPGDYIAMFFTGGGRGNTDTACRGIAV